MGRQCMCVCESEENNMRKCLCLCLTRCYQLALLHNATTANLNCLASPGLEDKYRYPLAFTMSLAALIHLEACVFCAAVFLCPGASV